MSEELQLYNGLSKLDERIPSSFDILRKLLWISIVIIVCLGFVFRWLQISIRNRINNVSLMDPQKPIFEDLPTDDDTSDDDDDSEDGFNADNNNQSTKKYLFVRRQRPLL